MTQIKHDIETGEFLVSKLFLWVFCIVLLVTLSGTAALPARADTIRRGNLAQKIAEAKLPADHLAIASYYRALVAESDKKARYHESIVEVYEGPKKDRNYSKLLVDHCRNLAWSYRYMIKQYESMAEEHTHIAEGLADDKE